MSQRGPAVVVRSLKAWSHSLSLPLRYSHHQQPIYESYIYPDPDAEKVIMASTVYCIHHKEGCQWSDELRKLKAHLNTCKYDTIPCTNNCAAMIPRVLMEDHLKYTCSKRRAKCEFCNKEFTGEMLEEVIAASEKRPSKKFPSVAVEPNLPFGGQSPHSHQQYPVSSISFSALDNEQHKMRSSSPLNSSFDF